MVEINETKFLSDWNIESITSSLNKSSKANKENMTQVLIDAYMDTMHHEKVLQSTGRVSRFIRSTKLSNIIAHNYMISQALESVTTKRKTTK